MSFFFLSLLTSVSALNDVFGNSDESVAIGKESVDKGGAEIRKKDVGIKSDGMDSKEREVSQLLSSDEKLLRTLYRLAPFVRKDSFERFGF